jgi:chromosome segregation ATPase
MDGGEKQACATGVKARRITLAHGLMLGVAVALVWSVLFAAYEVSNESRETQALAEKVERFEAEREAETQRLGELREEIAQLESSLPALSKKASKLKGETKALVEREGELRAEVRKFEGQKVQLQDLTKALDKKGKELQEVKDTISSLQVSLNDATKAQEAADTALAEKKKAENEKKKAENEKKKAEKDRKDADKATAIALDNQKREEKAFQDVQGKVKEKEDFLKTLTKKIGKLEEREKELPTDEQMEDLEQNAKGLKEKREEIDDLKRVKKDLEADKGRLAEQIAEQKKTIGKLQGIKRKAEESALKADAALRSAELNAKNRLEKDLKALKKNVAKEKNNVAQLEGTKAGLDKELQKLRKQQGEAEQKVTLLGEIGALKTKRKDLKDEIKTLEKKRDSLKKEGAE